MTLKLLLNTLETVLKPTQWPCGVGACDLFGQLIAGISFSNISGFVSSSPLAPYPAEGGGGALLGAGVHALWGDGGPPQLSPPLWSGEDARVGV